MLKLIMGEWWQTLEKSRNFCTVKETCFRGKERTNMFQERRVGEKWCSFFKNKSSNSMQMFDKWKHFFTVNKTCFALKEKEILRRRGCSRVRQLLRVRGQLTREARPLQRAAQHFNPRGGGEGEEKGLNLLET